MTERLPTRLDALAHIAECTLSLLGEAHMFYTLRIGSNSETLRDVWVLGSFTMQVTAWDPARLSIVNWTETEIRRGETFFSCIERHSGRIYGEARVFREHVPEETDEAPSWCLSSITDSGVHTRLLCLEDGARPCALEVQYARA